MQLGMWIARMPGTNQPRTFTIAEYWYYLRDRNMPGWGYPVRADLKRFVGLEMLQERPEMGKKAYCEHWTRLDTPLWNVFAAASVVLDPHEGFVAERRRLTVNDLSLLREELLRDQVDETDEDEEWGWIEWV
jgi:hypothetical protein